MTGSRPEGEHRSPPQLDTGVPHSARVWNYLLGGKDNFAADREMCDVLLQIFPGIVQVAREQRRFLVRSVRYLAARAEVRQFLDIGVGLPVGTSTHQVAQAVAPESRIVYVDNDPLVLLHARALLTSAPGGMTSYIEADVRDTGEILGEAARTLDFGQPVALVMLGMLGQLPDSADPGSVVARLLGALPPGSYLVLSDSTDTSPALNQAIAVYNANSASSYHVRAPERIAGFFDGLALVPPGVVTVSRWRPDVADASAEPRKVEVIGGVARKERPGPGHSSIRHLSRGLAGRDRGPARPAGACPPGPAGQPGSAPIPAAAAGDTAGTLARDGKSGYPVVVARASVEMFAAVRVS